MSIPSRVGFAIVTQIPRIHNGVTRTVYVGAQSCRQKFVHSHSPTPCPRLRLAANPRTPWASVATLYTHAVLDDLLKSQSYLGRSGIKSVHEQYIINIFPLRIFE